MTAKKAPASIIIAVALGVIFSVLFFLPDLFVKRHYSYGLDGKGTPTKAFPIDAKFPLIQEDQTKVERSIKDLIGNNPNGALVNFWATWCPPCLEELPSLEFLNRELKASSGKLPVLITISVDEAQSDVLRLYKTLDFKPTLTVLHDRDAEFSRTLGTTKFPETYWVDAQGKILYKWVGPQNWLSGDVIRKIGSLARHG